ncbi:MAG TPA: asparagine synthase C-terminal domain-containing protein [Methanotrichaceae archaeon]|nr:asparagine synthase C-terminal domain-containing protein [Methanotrichaceae archaeon]
MLEDIALKGWIELEGRRFSKEDIKQVLSGSPGLVSRFGGEFLLCWNECKARDHFGIMPGGCPPGEVICNGRSSGLVDPAYPPMDLAEAIEAAVRLRSDEGVVALSGGVDSVLVAQLAKRECVAVGMSGSHDLLRASQVAKELGLSLEQVVLDPGMIEYALSRVLKVIPRINPVDASVATTLYFVSEWAGEHGYERILAGQGADELFGGYARYLDTDDLRGDLERDFWGLSTQLARDQAVAALHGTYFSLPYMDLRVVNTARAILPEDKVCEGIRKKPLREVAARYLPSSMALYGKKAMQYGSGVMKEIQRLASKQGHKKSLQEYLDQMARAE